MLIKEEIIKVLENVTEETVDLSVVQASGNLIHDFGLNSLNLMQFIVELEETFDIEIDLGTVELSVFNTLDAISTYILNAVNGHAKI